MIAAGAAGVHWEDQLASEKKCGHLGGKVLVPTQQHVRTLNAARLAADVSGVPTIVVARTDALAATLLTTDVDERDAQFCTGERTAEGYYRVRGGMESVIARGLAYAPYADLIWVETSTPDLAQAREFAEALHKEHPGKLLAYNCSPSFNWRAALDDDTIARFQRELAAMGYRFQFITLAGFHALNHSMFSLAHDYAHNGMSAYVRLQEAEFAAVGDGYTAVRHQARGRHRLLRPRHHSAQPGQRHHGARRIDRGRAVRARRPTMTATTTRLLTGVEVTGAQRERFDEVLTPDALAFLSDLHQRFAGRRCDLLQARRERHQRIASGADPWFLAETEHIRRDDSWRVAAPAPGLTRRHVEITGPVEPKMAINALNSGADVWMADLEDATSPTWGNVVGSQLTLMDVLDRRVDFTTADGKAYCPRQVTADDHRATARLAPPREARRSSTGARSPPASSTSGCTCSTALDVSSAAAAARTSICPSSRATSRRDCGTTSSSTPRSPSACPSGPSAPPSSSRPSTQPSRWTRSSSSCATTRPASTRAAGTTSSASSRLSPNVDRGTSCRTAATSR